MARDDRPHRIKTPAIVELDDSIKEGLEEKFLSSMGEDVLELVELVLTHLDGEAWTIITTHDLDTYLS